MANPRTRNTIILDEPFRFLSEDHQEQAGNMMKEISRKLNLQILYITHNPILAEVADRTFNVSIKKGISFVKVSE
jgi:DNA repair exonuclease SbcCD ATPase subunit